MATSLTDLYINCADCEVDFAYTVAEQLFYAERGINHPTRCPECRARRRSERNSDAIKACDTNGGPMLWSDGFGNYGGSASASGRKGPRTGIRMFSTTCSSCGRATEVPFEPRGGRPVYCRDCFNTRRGR
jgi:CxxC-x17-CxxC domain-containing protein